MDFQSNAMTKLHHIYLTSTEHNPTRFSSGLTFKIQVKISMQDLPAEKKIQVQIQEQAIITYEANFYQVHR